MSKVHEALRRAEREREEARRSTAPVDAASVFVPRPQEAPRAAEAPRAPELPRAAEPARTAQPAGTAEPAVAAAGPARPAAPHVPLPERPAGAPDLRLDEALVAFARPRSMAAEQYRAIRQQLAAFGREVAMRTIVVTSPLAGEGKTTTAANLAIALGQELGRRICLADCDLRNPRIGALFGIPARDGLADILRGRTGLAAALVPTPVNDLWVLPAGHLPPNPAELLASSAMRELVDRLEARFDMVVLDSPPVVPIPDPAILSGLADGVVMVLQAGRTPRRLLDRALDRLHGAVLLGFVLNRTDEFRYYAGYYRYPYGA